MTNELVLLVILILYLSVTFVGLAVQGHRIRCEVHLLRKELMEPEGGPPPSLENPPNARQSKP